MRLDFTRLIPCERQKIALEALDGLTMLVELLPPDTQLEARDMASLLDVVTRAVHGAIPMDREERRGNDASA